MISHQKNIVVGASGLIGSALYKSFEENSVRVIGTYAKNHTLPGLIHLDLTADDFSELLDTLNPIDNVYILSAYSNPTWIHNNRKAAETLNLTGTKNLIDALREKNPRIIFMSSVEVFDGGKGFYRENDYPNPLNLYGAMKYEIESYLKSTYENSTIVRTGWNVGLNVESRCVVRLTYDSLLEQGARMARDNQFSISAVTDTADALRMLANYPEVRELHICADDKVMRVRLAELISENSNRGKEMDFDECLFSEIEYSEPRGRMNDLDNALSREVLGISYQHVHDIILDKVRFIDGL